jgi:hypothetical protein
MRILSNMLVLSVSLVLSLLAGEFLARRMLDPIDYLLPQLTDDDYLGHRIEGYSGGHDAWGFRNTVLPPSTDIVCIGDSMTYGISVRARDSWPAVLGRIRGDTVYNMGLGGYGPIQYLYLMQTRATELHPKTVIVGLNLGNDLIDVYNQVRFNKNWAKYGKLGGSYDNGPRLVFQPRPVRTLGSLRDWLAEHSILYALVTRASIFNFVRERELAIASDPSEVIRYRDETHNVFFNLSPTKRFLDMNDPRIKTAIEITKQVLLDMRDFSEKKKIHLVVTLIPTKERVYAALLARTGYLAKYPQLADAIHQEDSAHDVIAGYLYESGIDVVDVLLGLEAEAEQRDPYPRTDPHPNKDGYRVIAETVSRYLDNH